MQNTKLLKNALSAASRNAAGALTPLKVARIFWRRACPSIVFTLFRLHKAPAAQWRRIRSDSRSLIRQPRERRAADQLPKGRDAEFRVRAKTTLPKSVEASASRTTLKP